MGLIIKKQTEQKTGRERFACRYLHTSCCHGVNAQAPKSKSVIKAENLYRRTSAVISTKHLHLPLRFVVQKPETQRGERDLKDK